MNSLDVNPIGIIAFFLLMLAMFAVGISYKKQQRKYRLFVCQSNNNIGYILPGSTSVRALPKSYIGKLASIRGFIQLDGEPFIQWLNSEIGPVPRHFSEIDVTNWIDGRFARMNAQIQARNAQGDELVLDEE